MQIATIDTPQLGDRSYLVHDGKVALVIDAQRDIDRVLSAAAEAGVMITHVAETHVHNDYVTGGLALAKHVGAEYLVNAADRVDFDRRGITDGETLSVGSLTLRALATPGHTHTHLSFVVTDGDEEAVFSGGSLLYGSVGRTDLVAPGDTVPLTHAQYASARRLVGATRPDAGLFPTHGFGSFCSSGPATGAASSTIGEQLLANHALTDPDEAHFVAELIANLSAYPAYYVHMAPQNLRGPRVADLTVPEPIDTDELVQRLGAGEWVVDLRNRVMFAAAHLAGALSFEYGTGSSFTTYLGWLLPYDAQLTLIGSAHDIEHAIRDLSRIGVGGVDVAIGEEPAVLAPGRDVRAYRRVDWAGFIAARTDADIVLDVRRADEYAVGHVQGSINVPLHELLGRLSEVPDGRVLVHCGSGYRAGVAASILDRAGRDVVHVDARFAEAESAGVRLSEQNISPDDSATPRPTSAKDQT